MIHPGLAATAKEGERISALDYLGADLVRTSSARQMAEFHRNYDLLLTPMMPVPALPLGQDLNDPATERHWIDWSPFSYPVQPDPSAGSEHSLRPDECRAAHRPADRRPALCRCPRPRAARAFETAQPERRPPLAP